MTPSIFPYREEDYIPPRVAAEVLKVNARTVRLWARAGKLVYTMSTKGTNRYLAKSVLELHAKLERDKAEGAEKTVDPSAIRLYEREGKGIKRLARQYHVSQDVMRRYLVRNGVAIRQPPGQLASSIRR